MEREKNRPTIWVRHLDQCAVTQRHHRLAIRMRRTLDAADHVHQRVDGGSRILEGGGLAPQTELELRALPCRLGYTTPRTTRHARV
jgi:hypothetical protein